MGTSSRAAAWVAHLRAGGSTPWAAFTGTAQDGDDWLPGAQHLELLRRVNEVAPASAALAEAILSAPLPFRGLPDLDLVDGPATPGHGPEPVDPASLPDAELVRVAVSVLAPAAVRRPEPEAPDPAVGTRLVRRLDAIVHRPYRLAGDPVLAAHVRRALVARGRRPGDGGDVIVVGDAIDRMLADAWWHRVQRHGAPPWDAWLAGVVARDEVPQVIDLPAVATRWQHERPGRVVVGVGAGAVSAAAGGPAHVEVPRRSAAGAELERRVGMALAVLVEPDERTRLLRRGVLPAGLDTPEDEPLVLTPAAHAWATRVAERMTESLRADGYPVGTDALAPAGQPRGRVRRLTTRGVLPLAVAALHALPAEDLPAHEKTGERS